MAPWAGEAVIQLLNALFMGNLFMRVFTTFWSRPLILHIVVKSSHMIGGFREGGCSRKGGKGEGVGTKE